MGYNRKDSKLENKIQELTKNDTERQKDEN